MLKKPVVTSRAKKNPTVKNLNMSSTNTPGIVALNSSFVVAFRMASRVIVFPTVVPMFAPKIIGTPKRIAEASGNPLATILAIDIIVVATTALLLSRSVVARTPIASPVNGATPDSIKDKITVAHSLNISLKPYPTPSREQIKRKTPETRRTRT